MLRDTRVTTGRKGLLLPVVALGLIVAALLVFWEPQQPAFDVRTSGDRAGGSAVQSRAEVERGLDGDTRAARREVSTAPGEPVSTPSTELLLRVLDKATKEPIPNLGIAVLPVDLAVPELDGRSAATDARGEALWEDIPWGRVRVLPVLEDVVELAPGTRTQRTVELERYCAVAGTVRDLEGIPVVGAEVWTSLDNSSWTGAARRAVTDAEGAYRFALYRLKGGFSEVLFLFARSEGRAPSRVHSAYHPEPGVVLRRDITMGGPIGAVRGTVLGPGGEPVAGATVTVRPSAGTLAAADETSHAMGTHSAPPEAPVVTGHDGRFRFEGLPTGKARITALSGGAGAQAVANIRAGEQCEVQVLFPAGVTLHGTARDDTGQSIAGAMIETYGRDSIRRITKTDERGRFRMERLQPGEAGLTAHHEDRGRVYETVELEDGAVLEWNPVFPSGQSITGVLFDHDGQPAAELFLSVSSEGDYRSGTTDAQGGFSFENLPAAGYSIRVNMSGKGRFVLAEDVRPGAPPLELRLPDPRREGAVRGRVLLPDGEPVAGAMVRALETTSRTMRLAELAFDGRFHFDGMPAGSWELRVTTTESPALQRAFELADGQDLDLGNLRLEIPAYLLVRVRRAVEDEGWLAARLYGPDRDPTRHVVRGDGYVDLPPLRPGRYRLEVYGDRAPAVALEAEVTAGQRIEREVLLPAGVRRTLDVRMPDGRSDAELELVTYDPAGAELSRSHAFWSKHWGPQPRGFRPEAVRLVVTTADGHRGEAALGAAASVVVDLR